MHLPETVEQAVILKLTWLWNPFPRSITWDRWSADRPTGSTSSLPAKGASWPLPCSHASWLKSPGEATVGCFAGGSPRPGVFRVFTNDMIDGVKGTLAEAADDTWWEGQENFKGLFRHQWNQEPHVKWSPLHLREHQWPLRTEWRERKEESQGAQEEIRPS